MKKRITALLLAVAMTLCMLSLTSCNLVWGGLYGNTEPTGDTTINVEGGDTNNITIENPPEAPIAAAPKGLMSSVSIIAYHSKSDNGIFDSSATASRGSGVIYKLDKDNGIAYIVTNYHVVYDADRGISNNIDVYLYGSETSDGAINATYIGGALAYDIAVLRVAGSSKLIESIATAATFANSDELEVLDSVIAIGNALGKGISATVGNVNVTSEYLTMMGADEKTEVTFRVIRTDAAVNSGNSGGGLFNNKGEVIGIINAKTGSSEGMGYAIPSNVARAIADNIIHYCDTTNKSCVYRCILGITVESQEQHAVYDTETGKLSIVENVVVTDITSGSAASGVFKTGDTIMSISIDGVSRDITMRHQIIDFMLDAREGSKLEFKVLRSGEEITLKITVTKSMIQAYK